VDDESKITLLVFSFLLMGTVMFINVTSLFELLFGGSPRLLGRKDIFFVPFNWHIMPSLIS
jgi:hypothetical protein